MSRSSFFMDQYCLTFKDDLIWLVMLSNNMLILCYLFLIKLVPGFMYISEIKLANLYATLKSYTSLNAFYICWNPTKFIFSTLKELLTRTIFLSRTLADLNSSIIIILSSSINFLNLSSSPKGQSYNKNLLLIYPLICLLIVIFPP